MASNEKPSAALSPVDKQELKSKLAFVVRLLEYQGLIDFSGHASVRLPGTNHIMINPRKTPRPKLRPEDIVTIDLDCRLVEGEANPPSESAIHTEVYRLRPDVMAVAHLHSPMATLIATAKIPFVPVVYHGAIFDAGVPLLDNSGHIGNKERGSEMARLLGNRRALLIKGHGSVVTADSIETLLLTCQCLEENAERMYQLAQLGKLQSLRPDEIEEAKHYTRSADKVWRYWEAKLGRNFNIEGQDSAAPRPSRTKSA